MLQGAIGALSLDTVNARVAAALLIPLPVARGQSSVGHHDVTARPHDPRAGIPALMQRWRAVTRALASVRALEVWARATAPTPVMTANDVVASPDILHQRLDRWSARPSADALATEGPLSPIGQSAVPPSVLGVTLALTSPATTTTALGEAISGTIATSGTTPLVASGIADSPISTTASVSLTQDAGSGSAMSPTIPVSMAIVSAPSIVDAPISLTTEAAFTADIALSSTAVVTPTLPALDGAPTPTDGQITPTPGVTSSDSLTATTGAAISATVPLTEAVLGNAAPSLVGGARLALAVESGSPVLTVSSAPATDPLSLTVTLPATATDTLAPAGFSSARGALESVLRQGQALYADLKAKSAGVEADYRARLRGVVALNAQMERNYYARYYAWQRWNKATATYATQRIALNLFLQRRQAAKVAHALWVQRTAAWAAYARALKSYNDAVAAQGQAPAAPISGTADVSSTVPAPTGAPLPPRPVAPVWPGPEPAPFTEAMPPFPVPPGPAVSNPGLEPMGYALPTPPDAVPPWDGASLPVSLSLVSYGGIARGVNAAGYQHMTQDQVLSAGALDGVPSYIDPIKGIITTRFGGSTVFQAFHPGLDIANAEYTPIHAAAAGLVVWAGLAVPGDDHGSYGNCVIIKHNDHISTLYAHMDDRIHPLEVRVGDVVQQGQVIGYEGMTGWTTGPHLHFEVRVDNIQVDPLLLIPNPES
jgi:murein DD-endopeptidase MepM/ murein hydrolase activator NlpD